MPVEVLPEGRQRCFVINDPATGEEVASYPLMSREDVGHAVAAAREKFGVWSRSSFAERRRVLSRASSYLAENAGRYADEIAAENGKTRTDALVADILTITHLLKYYGQYAEKFLKPVRHVPGVIFAPGRKCYYQFEPKGVVGVISPWNYPFTLSAAPVVSAIAAGNSVVLKPSSQTTRSGLIVKEMFESAGLPEGVIQVVTGTGSVTGQALIENDGLDMIFFTGSTQVGMEVSARAAERLIPAILELGGKDVAIVTRNANLDRAAHGVVWGSFTNAGQTCIGTEIILVDRAVYEPFMSKVVELVSGLELGKEPGQVGAMTMQSQKAIIEEQTEDALGKGARIVATGCGDGGTAGCWCVPTLLADVTPEMDVFREETFGPLKSIIAFDSLQEAVDLANSVEYGLSGCVFTRDMAEGRWIAARIKTGSVNINDGLLTYAIPSLPFGGVKKSGIGRYHGKMGLRAFTDVKSITENRIVNMKRDLYWYPMWPATDLLFEYVLSAFYGGTLAKRVAAAHSAIRTIVRSMVPRD
jgi:acyl-CoA reductase-like NAD-dependent aldehyde dehydrogenase